MRNKSGNSWFEKLCTMGEESETAYHNPPKVEKKSANSRTKAKKAKKNGRRRIAENHDDSPYADESCAEVAPIDDCVFEETIYTPTSQTARDVSSGVADKKCGEDKHTVERTDNRKMTVQETEVGSPSLHKRQSAGRNGKVCLTQDARPQRHSGEIAHPALLYLSAAIGVFLTFSILLSFFMSRGHFEWTAETHPFRWVGYHVERLLFGVLGYGSFLLPVAMIYIPVDCLLNRRTYRMPVQWILAGVIVALFSAMVHAGMLAANLCGDTWNLAQLYFAGAEKSGGGIVGGYLGKLAYLGLGAPGTIAIGTVAVLLCGLSFVGTTPVGVFRAIRRMHLSCQERRQTRRAQREEEATQRTQEKPINARETTVTAPGNIGQAPEEGSATRTGFSPLQTPPTTQLVRKKGGNNAVSVNTEASSAVKPFTVREVEDVSAMKKIADARVSGSSAQTIAHLHEEQSSHAESVQTEEKKESEENKKVKVIALEEDPATSATQPQTVPVKNEDGDGGLTEELTSYPTHAELVLNVAKAQSAVDLPETDSGKKPESAPKPPKEKQPSAIEMPITTFSKADGYAGGFDYSAEGSDGAESAEEPAAAPAKDSNKAAGVTSGNRNGVAISVQTLSHEERERGNRIVSDEQVRRKQEEQKKSYAYPPIDLLEPEKPRKDTIEAKVQAKMRLLANALASFKVRIDNIAYVYGPTVTRYEVRPAPGVRVRNITVLADDIAMALSAPSIRIEAPIAGMNAVGIEVPNDERETVALRSLIDSDDFRNRKSRLTAALGKDVAGTPILFDIYKMPHLLIAGTTGSGKSVCINSIVMSLLYKSSPEEVKLIMIDPKTVEFSVYRDIPHLVAPIVCDAKRAAAALNLAVQEMEERYRRIQEVGVRDIAHYNEITVNDRYEHPFMPQIVIIIDELADLMMTARDEVEKSVCKLAQKARAAGMHLIIGTQRPSVDVITGVIKANVPSRIAFTVVAQVDSRTILDVAGAEKLIGMGDMLYAPVGSPKPLRVQGSFVSDEEVQRVVEFIKKKNEPVQYNQDFINNLDREAEMIGNKRSSSDRDADEDETMDGQDTKFYEALRVAVENKRISTSLLQRTLSIGYGRAAKIIDEMEMRGFIGPAVGNRPREILIDEQKYRDVLARRND